MSFRNTLKRLAGRRGTLLVRRLRTRRWSITGLYRKHLQGLRAIEIGGPSDCLGFAGQLPVYSCLKSIDNCNYAARTLWSSDAVKFDQEFVCEGSNLPAADASYGCAIASHCLEHTSNPIKALREWKRVLRPGGVLLLLLPHRDHTFDWRRPVTTLDHMRHDFERSTPETDLSHLEEILALHDLSRDPRAGTPEQFRARCFKNADVRAIHHHVFLPDTAAQLVREAGYSIIREDVEASNIILLCQKSQPVN